MQKYYTLSSKIFRSVAATAIAALTVSAGLTFSVVRSKNQALIYNLSELRILQASTVINPLLLHKVANLKAQDAANDPNYLELVGQVRSSVRTMPGASAQLIVISEGRCLYLVGTSSTGELLRKHPFKALISCPKQAIYSLGVNQIAIEQEESFLKLPDPITVYRPIRSSTLTEGVLALQLSFTPARDAEFDSFVWILALQFLIAIAVTVSLKFSLSRHMGRLTAIVVGMQDLVCQNYDEVKTIEVSKGSFDELDVLANEIKTAALRLKEEASKSGK